jgi:hypothetical protein
MIIRQTTEEAVVAAAAAVSVRARLSFRPYRNPPSYCHLQGKNHEALGVADVTIRPDTGCTQRKIGPTGRRIHAVCWHGHRDFLRSLFARTPSAVVISCVARYENSADFEASFAATGSQNVGGQMNPVPLDRACECSLASTAVSA